MFESVGVATTAALEGLLSVLSRVDRDVSDAERVDQLGVLERVKSAAAAAQARVTADFVDSQEQVAVAWRQRARECADGNDFEGWRAAREQARRATVQVVDAAAVDAAVGAAAVGAASKGRSGRRGSAGRRRGEALGVAGQVGLARRESPSRGSQQVAMAVALVREMPHTLAALEAGTLSEWRAGLLVRETAMLTSQQRSAVDAELFQSPGAGADQVGWWGDRELVRRVQAIAYRVDAASVVARCRGAESDRRVSIRPAADAMAYLTAFLPVAQGVAVYAALTAAAATARAAGEERGKGQVMADTLVKRLTGQPGAELVPVEVQVVITDRALFAGDDTPAQVPGYGTVPAGWARNLLTPPAERHGDGPKVWLRRLYTHPDDGSLVGMDSVRRVFDGGLRRYLLARDNICRTPWCDAPIRHLDHVHDHAGGGATTAANGQGLCVACNHTKQLPGWRAEVVTKPWLAQRSHPPDHHDGDDDDHHGDGNHDGEDQDGEDQDGEDQDSDWRPHTVVTTTPTGHAYRSTAPPVIPGQLDDNPSLLERHLERLLAA